VSVEQLLPHLYWVRQPDGERRVCQAVVAAERRTLVVDAGLPRSAERDLIPLLTSLSRQSKPVVLLLTHPDADHRGAAPALRDAFPHLEIWGHELDAAQLADPEVALTERYLAFAATDGIGPTRDRLEAMRARLGGPLSLDRRLSGDTVLDLGDRRAEILHAPGHSPGSVIAWLPAERIAVIGDAAMGRGIPYRDGSLMYPPMYSPPATYLETITRLERLRPTLILSGHETPLRGDAAARFLTASREAADRLSALIRECLDDAAAPTLAELCSAVAERYDGLPPEAAPSLAMTVHGVLAKLVDGGEVDVDAGPPRRFRRSHEDR
jgi:glyoxylase-like metal-dependent hydrolase (beta-lactamase superfamily II)